MLMVMTNSNKANIKAGSIYLRYTSKLHKVQQYTPICFSANFVLLFLIINTIAFFVDYATIGLMVYQNDIKVITPRSLSIYYNIYMVLQIVSPILLLRKKLYAVVVLDKIGYYYPFVHHQSLELDLLRVVRIVPIYQDVLNFHHGLVKIDPK